MLATMPALAATSQYPDPNRQTMWNNLTDGAHTLGQTPAQAKNTRQHQRMLRRRNRLKSINDAKQQAWLKSNGYHQ